MHGWMQGGEKKHPTTTIALKFVCDQIIMESQVFRLVTHNSIKQIFFFFLIYIFWNKRILWAIKMFFLFVNSFIHRKQGCMETIKHIYKHVCVLKRLSPGSFGFSQQQWRWHCGKLWWSWSLSDMHTARSKAEASWLDGVKENGVALEATVTALAAVIAITIEFEEKVIVLNKPACTVG